MKHKVSPEQELEMIRLYTQEGIRGHRLARLFGCSTTLLYRIIKRHGVQKGPALGQEDKRKIRASEEHAAAWLYTDGAVPVKDICSMYGCSLATLYDVIRRYGIPRRSKTASEGARLPRRGQPGYGPKRLRSRKNKLSGDAAYEVEVQRRLDERVQKYAEEGAKLNGRMVQPPNEGSKSVFVFKVKEANTGPAVLPPRQAVTVRQVGPTYGLKPVDVVLQVMPSVPDVPKERLMSGRGQPHRARLRFPPLPGEPGFVYEEDAA